MHRTAVLCAGWSCCVQDGPTVCKMVLLCTGQPSGRDSLPKVPEELSLRSPGFCALWHVPELPVVCSQVTSPPPSCTGGFLSSLPSLPAPQVLTVCVWAGEPRICCSLGPPVVVAKLGGCPFPGHVPPAPSKLSGDSKTQPWGRTTNTKCANCKKLSLTPGWCSPEAVSTRHRAFLSWKVLESSFFLTNGGQVGRARGQAVFHY